MLLPPPPSGQSTSRVIISWGRRSCQHGRCLVYPPDRRCWLCAEDYEPLCAETTPLCRIATEVPVPNTNCRGPSAQSRSICGSNVLPKLALRFSTRSDRFDHQEEVFIIRPGRPWRGNGPSGANDALSPLWNDVAPKQTPTWIFGYIVMRPHPVDRVYS